MGAFEGLSHNISHSGQCLWGSLAIYKWENPLNGDLI